MRVLTLLVCVVAMPVGAARAADDADRAAVRKQSARYDTALRQRNKAELEKLLHKDYQGRSMPGLLRLTKGDKKQVIAYWLGMSFTRLEVEVEGVRVFGDTAIETGTLSAELKEYGTNSAWNKVGYTRVWVREGKGWQLAHERF